MAAFTLHGYDHIKCAVENVTKFEKTLECFGFSRISQSIPEALKKPTAVWGSGEAFFVIYQHDHPEAAAHWKRHGDTIFDLSFIVQSKADHPMVYEGAGGMKHTLVHRRSFAPVPAPHGILLFDHNTLNVEQGQMNQNVDYYIDTFGFEKGQYFDIKGKETGLHSWVTRAPNKTVQIPFNESADDKSQIKEFIDIHHGAGVQHIALLTPSILKTMEAVKSRDSMNFKFLDLPDTYYELLPSRVKIRENIEDLKKHRILADADKNGGYLLQIFTGTLFGGFFFELIQREGNEGFGEGNFQALFDSMELDQKRRGVL